ncbi:helix-turn-helix domain-containing protein [Oxalobacteraceae bacterium CAVE-383]|nr:helix-turn-helix domain-containing protein [Oxalobacteraceae bacterium CAVE-383]
MEAERAGSHENSHSVRHVGIIVFEGVILADVVGVAEIFVTGDKLISSMFMGMTRYTLSLLSLSGGMVMSSSGVQVMTDPLPAHEDNHFDTLIVASGSGNFNVYRDPKLIDWLQKASASVRRMAALCTGVFVLAAAGLLDNKRITVHWALQDKLLREFPKVILDRDVLMAEDGGIYTTGDSGMGIDIALRLHEDDLGSAMAKRVAQSLLANPRQRESANSLTAWRRTDESLRNGKIRKASNWLTENMASSISAADAASFVSMSERNFQRQFKRETGETPHRFLQKIRLEAVCQHLRDTDLPIDKIARRCGFFSGEHVSKLFRKHLNTSPCEYRRNERIRNAQPDGNAGRRDEQKDLFECIQAEHRGGTITGAGGRI